MGNRHTSNYEGVKSFIATEDLIKINLKQQAHFKAQKY